MDKIAESNILAHVIGTVAILAMFFTVGNYYEDFFTKLHSEAYRAQLGQVSDYVSATMIDLVTLSQNTKQDQFLVKEIEPPMCIGEKLYNISLITMTPSYGDAEVIRVVTRIDALNIYSVSDLPWSLSAKIEIYNEQITSPDEKIGFEKDLLSDAAVSMSAQTKGCASIVVWCSKADGDFVIGLGVMDTE